MNIRAHAVLPALYPPAEYTKLRLNLSELLIQHPDATCIFFAEGDSKIGDRVFSDDLMIISREVKVNEQGIIVVNLNSEFLCKKLILSDSSSFHLLRASTHTS